MWEQGHDPEPMAGQEHDQRPLRCETAWNPVSPRTVAVKWSPETNVMTTLPSETSLRALSWAFSRIGCLLDRPRLFAPLDQAARNEARTRREVSAVMGQGGALGTGLRFGRPGLHGHGHTP